MQMFPSLIKKINLINELCMSKMTRNPLLTLTDVSVGGKTKQPKISNARKCDIIDNHIMWPPGTALLRRWCVTWYINVTVCHLEMTWDKKSNKVIWVNLSSFYVRPLCCFYDIIDDTKPLCWCVFSHEAANCKMGG